MVLVGLQGCQKAWFVPAAGLAGCHLPRGALPNLLMQPTNAGCALLRPRLALPAATMDRRLSQSRLQLISPSLGSTNKDLEVAETSWYAAVLIMKGVAGPDWDDQRLTERQLRLVRASDADAAYERALQLGREAEHEYTNEASERMRWCFVGLAELAEIDDAELGDGSEVFSSYSSKDAELLTRPREELAVFWTRANAERTARDLLDEN
jgi:uncharacterized protein DUF4288